MEPPFLWWNYPKFSPPPGVYQVTFPPSRHPYLSDSCPDTKEPRSTPTKNRDVVRGVFQSSSHTRFHCQGKTRSVSPALRQLRPLPSSEGILAWQPGRLSCPVPGSLLCKGHRLRSPGVDCCLCQSLGQVTVLSEAHPPLPKGGVIPLALLTLYTVKWAEAWLWLVTPQLWSSMKQRRYFCFRSYWSMTLGHGGTVFEMPAGQGDGHGHLIQV